jgi:hypothetical protein
LSIKRLHSIGRYNYHTGQLILLQLLVFTFLYWLSASRYWYYFGPDFISYTSIAKNYAAGNWHQAINSWWSPAYSWLLAFFSYFFPDPLTANKVVQFCAGLVAVPLLRQLIFFHTPVKKDLYAEWACLLLVPALVFWALQSDTPDFCAAVVLIWFFLKTLQLTVSFSRHDAVIASITGALAYLFKSYNFYFIIAFGLFVLVWKLVTTSNRKPVLRQWITVALPFLLLSFIWIGLMALRYKKITVTSIAWHQPCTDKYVLQLKPVAAACDCSGLQFDSANITSNWETPGTYPASSLANMVTTQQNTGSTVLRNAGHFFKSFISRYQLVLLFVLVLLLPSFWRKNGWWYIAFSGIYCSGYFMLHLEHRFFIMPLLLLMVAIIVSYLRIAETIQNKWVNSVVLLAIGFLLVHSYLYHLNKFDENTVPEKTYQFSKQQTFDFKGKNIAAAAGLYDDGLYFSFYNNSRFYGSLTTPENDARSIEALKKNKIDYLLSVDGKGNYQVKPANQVLSP